MIGVHDLEQTKIEISVEVLTFFEQYGYLKRR